MNPASPLLLAFRTPGLLQRLSIFLLIVFSSWLRAGAQPHGGNTHAPTIEMVGVLPDRGYTWQRIQTDTTLAFAPADSLHPTQARRYWLKLRVRNPSRYAEAARLAVLPNLDNTLFYFDEDARAWQARRAGAAVGTYPGLLRGELPLPLPGRAAITCYVRLDLGTRAALPPATALRASVVPDAAARERVRVLGLAWVVSMTVLGLLLLFNLYAYVRFRARILLYLLVLLAGGMLYITGYRGFFRTGFPAPVFSLRLLPTGQGYSYTPDNLLIHLSVLGLLLGAGLATRAYLHTARYLPRLDAALRVGLWGYAGFSAVVALVNMGGFYSEVYSIAFDNLLVAGVLGLLLATAVAARRRRLPGARAYLLVSVGPVLASLGLAGYHIVVTGADFGTQLLPDLAIVAYALGFTGALGSRVKLLEQTLRAREQEARELALDIARHELRHREIVLKNSHVQTALRALQQRQQVRDAESHELKTDLQQREANTEVLQAQLEANQRELASTLLYVEQKNALLAELKQQLQELPRRGAGQAQELAGVQSLLQSSLYLDEDWNKFKLHFEQVHPRFFEELQARYPALTKNEQRLYCYFHLNLATKEIAALLNIDPDSVRRAKSRLYKKIAAANGGPPMPPVGGKPPKE